MAIFKNLKVEEFAEIIESFETKVLARINQIDARLEKLERSMEELKRMKERVEEIGDFAEESLRKNSSRAKGKNKRGEARDERLLEFLRIPRSTAEICAKFSYNRSYASNLLNTMKKRGIIKVARKEGTVPYFEVK